MLTIALLALACQNTDSVDDTGDGVDLCVVAVELCDGLDNDCNGIIDDDPVDAQTYYWDNDQDGYGSGDLRAACIVPEQGVDDAGDCDDKDPDVNPGQPEVCDGVDNDCDDAIDGPSSQDAELYFSDNDHDGYGAGEGFESCEQPPDTSETGGDCDDADPQMYPGAWDPWYDGIDSDCLGNSDYDVDGDGSDSSEWGGTDCLDQDASVTSCRPLVSCTHPSASMLQSVQPNVSSNLAFGDDCSAWLSGIAEGVSYASQTDVDGNQTLIPGFATFDQQSIALSPLTGAAVFSQNVSGDLGLGYLSAGGLSLSDWVRGSLSRGTLWKNSAFNRGAAQLAWDSNACIWTPGFSGDGSLSCVDESDASVTDVITDLAHIEAVALDSTEQVYISVGDQVLLVDTSAGSTTLIYTASADVLSMVFDWNDDLYLSTTASEIEHVPADGSSAGLWATAGSQVRIAISPDGWLVAVQPESQRFEEWELPAY